MVPGTAPILWPSSAPGICSANCTDSSESAFAESLNRMETSQTATNPLTSLKKQGDADTETSAPGEE